MLDAAIKSPSVSPGSEVVNTEAQVPLARHIPVHITYFTAWVDGAGTLQIRNDVYGHDQRMEQMLGLS